MTLHPAQVFLSTLFGETPREVFQVFPDHPGSDVRAAHRALPWLEAEPLLTRLNDRGAGVFVTINHSRTGGRTAADIDACRCLFVDGDGVALPDLWPCPPTLVQVREASAGTAPHWQAFWRLAPGEDLASFSPAQRALAGFYGGDQRVHDLPRVMRLPGFRHQKDPAAPTSYRIASVDAAAVYTIAEVLAAHGIDPMAVAAAVDDAGALPEAMTLPVDPCPEEVAAAAALFDRPVEVNGRHHTALALTIECVAAGMPDADLMARLDEWFRAHGRTPQPREKRNLIRDARKGLKAGRFTATTPGVGARSDFTAAAAPTASALTPDAAAAQVKALIPWRDQAVKNKDGTWKSHVRNVQLVFENDARVSQSVRFNEFTSSVEVVLEGAARAPWRKWAGTAAWVDDDDTNLASWIAQEYYAAMGSDVVHAAVRPYARTFRSYHPVRDYLRGLTWDGKPRLDTWTVRYLGAEDTPHHRAVGARFLLGAVARILHPGCQMDTMLVLEGEQGTGKSRAARTLFGDWFNDAMIDISHKDAALVIRGKWGVEFGEMHAVSRAEQTQIKAYLSRRSDRQRDSHDRCVSEHDRQCVFIGTTNQQFYQMDSTGGRRFWPVACTRIDPGKLARDRDQLWAEALARHEGGEPHHLTVEEEAATQAEQGLRHLQDDWIERIEAWLKEHNGFDVSAASGVTGLEVWVGALAGEVKHIRRTDQMRIAECMRKIGFKATAFRRKGSVMRGYVGVTTVTPAQL